MGNGDHGDVESTATEEQPSSDKAPDKAVVAREQKVTEDRPPTPPKRDFKAPPMVSEPRPRSKIGSFPRPEFVYKPENTEGCMNCLKNIIILFNLLIWLFGAALTGLGIWIKVDSVFWDIQTGLDMKQFTTAAYVLIVAGVFIMLIGFAGCYGAYAQSMCLLIVYSVVVMLIILLEIGVMALVFTASRNKEVKEEIKSKARKAMQDMTKVEDQRYFLDLLQAKLKCCGIEGPDDYQEEGIPHSCTNPETGYPFEQGCLTSVMKYFEEKAVVLGGVAIAVFILQLGVLILTLCLVCGIKNAAANAIF